MSEKLATTPVLLARPAEPDGPSVPPSPAPQAHPVDRQVQLAEDRQELRAVARRAREAAGLDIYAMAVGLGKRATYASKISEGETGAGHYQLEWLAAVRQEAAGRAVLGEFFAGPAGPAWRRAVEIMRREMPGMLEMLRRRVAEEMGIPVAEVSL